MGKKDSLNAPLLNAEMIIMKDLSEKEELFLGSSEGVGSRHKSETTEEDATVDILLFLCA